MSENNLVFDQQYKEKGFAKQRRYPNEQLIQFLAANFFPIQKDQRKDVNILELGCGSGANLWMIAREGFNTFGQDISGTAIDLCRQMLQTYGVTANLMVGNFKKLEYQDNYFDAIIDVVSLQHTDINGHLETYQEIYRCLKPGGRFFSWHLGANSMSFKEGGGKRIDRLTIDNISNPSMPLTGNGMTCFLTPTDAKDFFVKIGFSNIQIELVTRTYKNMTQIIEYLAIQAQKI